MDEIAGYFPPVANPPSKPPLLTLLKQGRAFGLGVVLATQNPVDLDYKGLANTGTWFLGRLQTERDKERVLDGLQGATAGTLDRAEADRILSALGKRVFLLHNVHEQAPVIFQTRWTLSYLRGPLSRDQIRAVMAGRAKPATGPPAGIAVQPRTESQERPPTRATTSDRQPVLPPEVQQFFLPPDSTRPQGSPGSFTPVILGVARVAFSDAKLGIDVVRDVVYGAPIGDGAVAIDWERASRLEVAAADLRRTPDPPDASFEALPSPAAQPKQYAVWEKSLAQWLARSQKVELLRHRDSKLVSRPDESERDFRIRVGDALRSARDEAVDGIRRKFAAKHAALTERLRRAEGAVARESEQASHQKLQTVVSVGATLLGALLGRKAVSTGTLGRATTAARGVSRTMKEASDVTRASESADAVRQQIQELDEQIREETQALTAGLEAGTDLERVTVSPKRGQISVQFVALGWDPPRQQ
jgi:hypothetical protein